MAVHRWLVLQSLRMYTDMYISGATPQALTDTAFPQFSSLQGRAVLHRIRAGQLLLLLVQESWLQHPPLPSMTVSSRSTGPGNTARPARNFGASRSLAGTDVKIAVLEALALTVASPGGMQLLTDQATVSLVWGKKSQQAHNSPRITSHFRSSAAVQVASELST